MMMMMMMIMMMMIKNMMTLMMTLMTMTMLELTLTQLNTWSVDRLGWVKQGRGGGLVAPELQSLASRFVPRVENCLDENLSGYFRGGLIDQEELHGKDVREEFRFVSKVRVWRRHVEVEHGESPLVAVTLQHRSRVGVVVQFSSSTLADFSGLLYQDSNSQLQLNLSLVEAAGTISGEVVGLGESSQSLVLRLGQAGVNIMFGIFEMC